MPASRRTQLKTERTSQAEERQTGEPEESKDANGNNSQPQPSEEQPSPEKELALEPCDSFGVP